jgi:hypothetical protein
MVTNYLLLAAMGSLSIFGIVEMVRGGTVRIRPFRTIGAAIVFILVLIATICGMDYAAFVMKGGSKNPGRVFRATSEKIANFL